MSLLVRKISRGKWPDDNNCSLENIPGDAISDLRTFNNTLSFWYVTSEDDLKEAIIALASGSKIDTVEKIDIVWVDIQQLLDKDVKIVSSPGDTAIDDLAETHRDVCNLTYSSLGIVSKIILDSIHKGQYKRMGKTTVKDYLIEALNTGRINKNKCKHELFSLLEEPI
jgi:hypothetical protein